MPGNVVGDQPNQTNYDAAGFTLTREVELRPDQNYLTDVGAFSGSPSGYGTFDQAGNVWEFIDEVREGMRSLRGGRVDQPVEVSTRDFCAWTFSADRRDPGSGYSGCDKDALTEIRA